MCKDGFAAAYAQEDMEKLGQAVGYNYRIQEVDNSAIVLILEKV